MSKFDKVADAGGLSQQGIDDAALQKQIDDLKIAVGTAGGGGVSVISSPAPCTPNFILGYERKKKRIRPQMCVNVGANVETLKVIVVRTADRTNDATFQASKIHYVHHLTDEQQTTGHIEFKFGVSLEYSTQYDLVQLVTKGTSGKNRFPTADPAFNTAPILQFTTPDPYNAPSGPREINIREAGLDPSTKQFDAYVILRVYAPLTDTGTGQSFQAAQVDWAQVRVLQLSTNLVLKEKQILDDVELTQTTTDPDGITGRGFVDITLRGLKPGAQYQWHKNVLHTAGEKKESTAGALNFYGADIAKAAAGIPEITSTSVTANQNDPNDGRTAELTLNFTQPTPSPARPTATAPTNLPVALKFATIKRDAVQIKDDITLHRDDLHTAGAKSFHLGHIKTKKLTTHTITVTLTAFGGSTRDVSITFGTGDWTGGDNAAPGNLPTPQFIYKRGKLHCKLKLGAVTNKASLNKMELCITDQSSKSLNLDAVNSDAAAPVNTFYEIGTHKGVYSVPIERDQIRRIFAPTGTIICKFRLTNAIGSTTSANSNTLDLSTLKDITYGNNPANLIRNGHFTYNDGTVAKRWEGYSPATGAFTTLDQTGRIQLDLSGHRAKWRNISADSDYKFLVQNLGRTFFRSDYYSCSWNIFSNGSPTIDKIDVGLYTQKTLTNTISGSAGGTTVSGSGFTTDGVKVGTYIGNGTEFAFVTSVSSTSLGVTPAWASSFSGVTGFVIIPQSTVLTQTNLSLSTADLFQKGTILTHSDLDTSRDIYFAMTLQDVVDTVTFPFIDAVCLNFGTESAGYQRSVDSFETNSAGTSENFDTQPTAGSSTFSATFIGSTTDDSGLVQRILT